MTPRQAPLVLLTLICGWLALRSPAMLADLAAYRERLQSTASQSPPPHRRAVRQPTAPPGSPSAPLVRQSGLEVRASQVGRLLVEKRAHAIPPLDLLAEPPVTDLPEFATFVTTAASTDATAAQTEQDALAIATEAYALLRKGDRRRSAAGLAQAIDTDGLDPAAANWRADLRALRKRWSVDSYAVVRPNGEALPDNSDPRVLGGTQYGVSARWRLDPLAPRPLDVIARLVGAPATSARTVAQSQAAVGLSWRPLAHIPATLALERLIRVHGDARDDWLARIAAGAGGGYGPTPDRPQHWLAWSVYGETNIVGVDRGDLSGGFDAKIGIGLALSPRLTLTPDLELGAQGQRSPALLARLDAGPGLSLNWQPSPLSLNLRLGYRWRLAGDARPGKSPLMAITIAY